MPERAPGADPSSLAFAGGGAEALITDVVIDTQIVLDLLLFGDTQTRPLRLVLAQGKARWLATPGMRGELVRVLGYPPMRRALERRTLCSRHVLAGFDQMACLVAAAPPAAARCRDPDDQCFVDLAVAHRARLLSKDRAVLALRNKLAAIGVTVAQSWI